ncbi:hypothetical protein LDENG_00276590 [Lucifuga dentata]|nr:hypothetical protein LDENG_00276590 [Lucifuga dentata]
MFQPNILNFHTHNVTDNHFKAYYWNGELKMFFLPSRPPLVSVHSAIKINLLILETFLG